MRLGSSGDRPRMKRVPTTRLNTAAATEMLARIGKLRDALRNPKRVVKATTLFEAISPVRTPSGIVAIAHHHSTTADAILEQARLFALVVVDVQDPGNIGSLMRVAEAGGVTGVIVAGESANPFSWKAIRGSMGSVLRVPVARSLSIDTVMHDIRKTNTKAIAAVPRDGWDPE